ncbi:MAG: hypothetical protein ACR2O8_01395, partial [Rhizobiaceae bacterium]
ITPFNAWLKEVTPELGRIDLFYCVKGRKNAPHLAQIEALTARLDNVTLHVIDSLVESRLSASKLTEVCGETLRNSHVFFCGPELMRENLRRDLQAKGVPHRRFHFEEFEIRSGIGVRKFIAYVIQKAGLANRYPETLGKLS